MCFRWVNAKICHLLRKHIRKYARDESLGQNEGHMVLHRGWRHLSGLQTGVVESGDHNVQWVDLHCMVHRQQLLVGPREGGGAACRWNRIPYSLSLKSPPALCSQTSSAILKQGRGSDGWWGGR